MVRVLIVSGRRSRGVGGGLDDAAGLQSQVSTLRRSISDNPANFANCESFVFAGKFASAGAGIIDTRTLSQTRSSSATEVGGGEQLPLSLSSQSRQAAAVDDVGGSYAAVSDAAVGAGNGSTELAGHHGGGVTQTLTHSGDQSQLRSGGTTGNTRANHITTVNTERGAVHKSAGGHLDAVSDIGPDILMEIRGRG